MDINNTVFDDQELQEAWIEWEAFRKEKKKTLTPRSVKMQIKWLTGRSKQEIIGILEQSIRNGWTGLFELKKQYGQTNKNTTHIASLANHYAQTYGATFTGGTDGQGTGSDAK